MIRARAVSVYSSLQPCGVVLASCQAEISTSSPSRGTYSSKMTILIYLIHAMPCLQTTFDWCQARALQILLRLRSNGLRCGGMLPWLRRRSASRFGRHIRSTSVPRLCAFVVTGRTKGCGWLHRRHACLASFEIEVTFDLAERRGSCHDGQFPITLSTLATRNESSIGYRKKKETCTIAQYRYFETPIYLSIFAKRCPVTVEGIEWNEAAITPCVIWQVAGVQSPPGGPPSHPVRRQLWPAGLGMEAPRAPLWKLWAAAGKKHRRILLEAGTADQRATPPAAKLAKRPNWKPAVSDLKSLGNAK